MISGSEEDPSGVNGRLRPRKSSVPGPQRPKSTRNSDGKTADDKPKKVTTPAETSTDISTKASTLTTIDKAVEFKKSNSPANFKITCSYCDKKFASKQSMAKHLQRIHISELGLSQDKALKPKPYRSKLRKKSKTSRKLRPADAEDKSDWKTEDNHEIRHKSKRNQKYQKSTVEGKNDRYPESTVFNGLVISCEIKPSEGQDTADIEDKITTNFIMPRKDLVGTDIIDKNAVIVLDDIQFNKRMPSNFSFHNSDADQILSRLGVVHRSPRSVESTMRDWYKQIEESTKFERCFDTSFYSKVASNVQENLTKFLDGTFNRQHLEPENVIKTRKAKNSVVINTVEGFPILLACQQYSRNVFDAYMPRALAPKHKWKWDSIEIDRNMLNPDQIKRDSHVNNCIVSMVSSLDVWTQLSMRRKFEAKFHNSSYNEKKTEKQNIISNELKEILESREIPKPSSQVAKYGQTKKAQRRLSSDFPSCLGLMPAKPDHELQPAVLSGEWVRPRCYVCCACGKQTPDAKSLAAHTNVEHPLTQVQHYEVVGEVLLNNDILKHLYVPPAQPKNRSRPLRGIRECTKCKKVISLDDLHEHILECAGDTPVIRKKVRPRPFGVRRRRPRLSDETNSKKLRKDIRHRQRQQAHIRPRVRTEVGDAETIRRMLADLPAKRHRVVVNSTSLNMRPRRRHEQMQMRRNVMRRPSEDPKNKKRIRTEKTGAGNKKVMRNDSHANKTKKVSRVVSKVIRQRSAVIRKSKRRTTQAVNTSEDGVIEKSAAPAATPVSTGEVQTNSLSIGGEAGRIDLRNESGDVREHAARNNSNNDNRQSDDNRRSDDNRPHPNDQNRNSQNQAPQQNEPLKHSIERLTANTEKHDKSVQFQPHFLVQQECYKNIDAEFSPAGQQVLFENESAVLRVDKPPLSNDDQSEQADPFGNQKCKKARKGLNACIAMLKNKLTDPDVPMDHRSVQCDTADFELYITQRPSTSNRTQTSSTGLLPNVPKMKDIPSKEPKINASKCTDIEAVEVLRGNSKQRSSKAIDSKVAQVLPNDPKQNCQEVFDHRFVKSLPKDHKQSSSKLIAENTLVSSRNKKESTSNFFDARMFNIIAKETNQFFANAIDSGPVDYLIKGTKQSFSKVIDKEVLEVFTKEAGQGSSTIIDERTIEVLPKGTRKHTPNVMARAIEVLPKDINQSSSKVVADKEVAVHPKDLQDSFSKVTNLKSIEALPNDQQPNTLKVIGIDVSTKNLEQSTLEVTNIHTRELTPSPSKSLGFTAEEIPRTSNMLELPHTLQIGNPSAFKVPPKRPVPRASKALQFHAKEPTPSTSKPIEGTYIKPVPNTLRLLDIAHDPIQYLVHESAIPRAHTNTGPVSMILSPLDLSGKRSVTRTSEISNTYETLDLSNKGMKSNKRKENPKNRNEDILSNDEVVDLCIKSTRPPEFDVTLDLSTKNQKNHSTETLTNVMVKDQEPKNHLDKLSKPSHMFVRSVYDPSLKIPQYMMRVTSTNTSTTPITTSNRISDSVPDITTEGHIVASQNSKMLPIHEGIGLLKSVTTSIESTSSYLGPPTSVNSVTSSMAVGTASEHLHKDNNVTNKTHINRPQRSSPPLYTVASTSQQSASSFVGPVISPILATTIVNTVTSNVSTITTTSTEKTPSDGTKKDTQIEEKIALLPNEIVEILGTMPVDHRNQLLNILPQYIACKSAKKLKPAVDSPPESLMTPNDIGDLTFSKNEIATQTLTSAIQSDCPPEFLNVDTEKFLIDPITGDIQERLQKESENIESLAAKIDFNITNTILPKSDIIKISESGKTENEENVLNLCQKTPLEGIEPVKTNQNRTGNEKTASLRAVRIKTSSERRKSHQQTQIIEPLNIAVEQSTQSQSMPNLMSTVLHENIDTFFSPAIQQAEISSTQRNATVGKLCHTNKEIERQINDPITNDGLKDINAPAFEAPSKHITPLNTINKSLEQKDVQKDLGSQSRNTDQKPETSKENNQVTNLCQVNSITDEIGHTKEIIVSTESKTKSDKTFDLKMLPKSEEDIEINQVIQSSNTIKALKPSQNECSQNSKSQTQIEIKLSDADDSDDDVSLAVIAEQRKRYLVVKKQNKSESAKSKEKQTTKSNVKDYVDLHASPISTNEKQRDDDKISKDDTNKIVIKESAHKEKKFETDVISETLPELPNVSKNKKTKKTGRRNLAKNSIIPTETQLICIESTVGSIDNSCNKENSGESSYLNLLKEEFKSDSNVNCQSASNINNSRDKCANNATCVLPALPGNSLDNEIESSLTSKPCEPVVKVTSANDMSSTIKTQSDSPQLNLRQTRRKNKECNQKKDIHSNTINESVSAKKQTSFQNLNIENKFDGIITSHINQHEEERQSVDTHNSSKEINSYQENHHGNKRIGRMRKTNISPKRQPADEFESLAEFDQIKPLRRSRRGKSLYINPTSDLTSDVLKLDSETSTSKIPLTKKQLIFSKLMLDEESLTKTDDSIVKFEEKLEIINNKTTEIEDNECIVDDTASTDSSVIFVDTTTLQSKSLNKNVKSTDEVQHFSSDYKSKSTIMSDHKTTVEPVSNLLQKNIHLHSDLSVEEAKHSKVVEPSIDFDNTKTAKTLDVSKIDQYDFLPDKGNIISKNKQPQLNTTDSCKISESQFVQDNIHEGDKFNSEHSTKIAENEINNELIKEKSDHLDFSSEKKEDLPLKEKRKSKNKRRKSKLKNAQKIVSEDPKHLEETDVMHQFTTDHSNYVSYGGDKFEHKKKHKRRSGKRRKEVDTWEIVIDDPNPVLEDVSVKDIHTQKASVETKKDNFDQFEFVSDNEDNGNIQCIKHNRNKIPKCTPIDIGVESNEIESQKCSSSIEYNQTDLEKTRYKETSNNNDNINESTKKILKPSKVSYDKNHRLSNEDLYTETNISKQIESLNQVVYDVQTQNRNTFEESKNKTMQLETLQTSNVEPVLPNLAKNKKETQSVSNQNKNNEQYDSLKCPSSTENIPSETEEVIITKGKKQQNPKTRKQLKKNKPFNVHEMFIDGNVTNVTNDKVIAHSLEHSNGTKSGTEIIKFGFVDSPRKIVEDTSNDGKMIDDSVCNFSDTAKGVTSKYKNKRWKQAKKKSLNRLECHPIPTQNVTETIVEKETKKEHFKLNPSNTVQEDHSDFDIDLSDTSIVKKISKQKSRKQNKKMASSELCKMAIENSQLEHGEEINKINKIQGNKEKQKEEWANKNYYDTVAHHKKENTTAKTFKSMETWDDTDFDSITTQRSEDTNKYASKNTKDSEKNVNCGAFDVDSPEYVTNSSEKEALIVSRKIKKASKITKRETRDITQIQNKNTEEKAKNINKGLNMSFEVTREEHTCTELNKYESNVKDSPKVIEKKVIVSNECFEAGKEKMQLEKMHDKHGNKNELLGASQTLMRDSIPFSKKGNKITTKNKVKLNQSKLMNSELCHGDISAIKRKSKQKNKSYKRRRKSAFLESLEVKDFESSDEESIEKSYREKVKQIKKRHCSTEATSIDDEDIDFDYLSDIIDGVNRKNDKNQQEVHAQIGASTTKNDERGGSYQNSDIVYVVEKSNNKSQSKLDNHNNPSKEDSISNNEENIDDDLDYLSDVVDEVLSKKSLPESGKKLDRPKIQASLSKSDDSSDIDFDYLSDIVNSVNCSYKSVEKPETVESPKGNSNKNKLSSDSTNFDSKHLKRNNWKQETEIKNKEDLKFQEHYASDSQSRIDEISNNSIKDPEKMDQDFVSSSSLRFDSDEDDGHANEANVNNQKTRKLAKNVEPNTSGVSCNYLKENIVTKSNKINKRKLRKSLNQSPLSKRSKITKQERTNFIFSNQEIDFNSETQKHNIGSDQATVSTDKNTINQYTDLLIPRVAARRTRSKSMAVKEDPYDPYNIQFDDKPLENYELSRKRKRLSVPENPSIKPKLNPLVTKKTKKTGKCVESDNDTSFDEANNINAYDKKESKKIYHSDSEDSSKSDLPLKNYVSNKSGKHNLSEESNHRSRKRRSCLSNKSRKVSLPEPINTLTTDNNESTEEQLRSEQFMESFGFFSERKPRKSNLLASKKISETFHIIADDTEDSYYEEKETVPKKVDRKKPATSKKSDSDLNADTSTDCSKKGEQNSNPDLEDEINYCEICRKEFRRPDNFLRHQMTLNHIVRLSRNEMDLDMETFPEEPNYLTVYKQHLIRLKRLTEKIQKRNKMLGITTEIPKIELPGLAEVIAEARMLAYNKHTRGALSRDEELFIDCCELLKEGTSGDRDPRLPSTSNESGSSHPNDPVNTIIEEARFDSISDGDVDSITARTILESEEVRNLENDLISGLKERAVSRKLLCRVVHLEYTSRMDPSDSAFQRSVTPIRSSEGDILCTDLICDSPEPEDMEGIIQTDAINAYQMSGVPKPAEPLHSDLEEKLTNDEPNLRKAKKSVPKVPDGLDNLDNIDMFEDKFDKIKRKCRSQAAAVKTASIPMVPVVSRKSEKNKKTDKAKGKKNIKKNQQSAIPTKGALKGFDGIKVSIPTSEINISAIVPNVVEKPPKKKKKRNGRKKRGRNDSGSSYKCESDDNIKDNKSDGFNKNVDVYEFMDNEDADMLEFRSTTMKERYKPSFKDIPSTSKTTPVYQENEDISESGSDGDDFVYMSDDYVCSADETENSLMSCELPAGSKGADSKKTSSTLKRKDVVEKNAVMGKIFKNNAVRADKKQSKSQDSTKTVDKAILDQLFDSLLEERPNSTMPKVDNDLCPKPMVSNVAENNSTDKCIDFSRKESEEKVLDHSVEKKSPERTHRKQILDNPSSRQSPETPGNLSSEKSDAEFAKKSDDVVEDIDPETSRAINEILENLSDSDAGVARHRTRRKCTVGKQNILAESWSSESEADGSFSGRPNSEVSLAVLGGRKRRGKRGSSHQGPSRRARHVTFKKQDESRVSSLTEPIAGCSGIGRGSGGHAGGEGYGGGGGGYGGGGRGYGGGGGRDARAASRSEGTYDWSSDGETEEVAHGHAQQHGWIVGNSHKKLVTMLAHAKGKKRDDRRHYVE